MNLWLLGQKVDNHFHYIQKKWQGRHLKLCTTSSPSLPSSPILKTRNVLAKKFSTIPTELQGALVTLKPRNILYVRCH